MSTELKNTLFRFVTMRAPQLTDKSKNELLFVKHPEIGIPASPNGEFPKLLSDPDFVENRKEQLEAAIIRFESKAIQTPDDLKTDLVKPDLYEFANWLAQKRTSFTKDELHHYVPVNSKGPEDYHTLAPLTESNRVELWDNLIYQSLTFKSGYVRDMIISVLVADTFLKKFAYTDLSLEILQNLAQAKVVMPKPIFGTKAAELSDDNEELPVSVKHLEKDVQRIRSEIYIANYSKILEELEVAEKQYQKKEQKTYETAYNEYLASVELLYENADTITKTITDCKTGCEKTIKEYVNLKIPKFSYTAKPELNLTNLTPFLSAESLAMVSGLAEGGFSTFTEAKEILKKNIDSETATIFQNTAFTQKVINANGIILPVQSGISATPASSNAVAITGQGGNNTPISLYMALGEISLGSDIVAATYSAVFNDNTTVNNTAFEDNWVGDKLNVKLFNDSLNFSGKSNGTLSGTYTLSNGDLIHFTATFKIKSIRMTGFHPVVSFTIEGGGSYRYQSKIKPDTSGTPNPVPDKEAVPLNGITRLGIADYRKVEQEICCYVPGEVSHIENIMAREYKDRTTKRSRKAENTTTLTSESEREKLTDSTTTDRYEMNQEVAKVIAENTAIGAYTNATFDAFKSHFNVGGNFAYNTSTEESNSQAVTQAKEITERALDRIVQKVKEERISKVIEEYSEENAHGFDNRKGDEHVTGVYRWVDKIYKNKIVNYGKRLIYEFMVPEPAAFHKTWQEFKKNDTGTETLEKPVDPRNVNASNPLTDHTKVLESTYAYWAAIYNAEVDPVPQLEYNIGKSLSGSYVGSLSEVEFFSLKDEIKIPEGYQAINGKVSVTATQDYDNHNVAILTNIGDQRYTVISGGFRNETSSELSFGTPYRDTVPVSVTFSNFFTGTANFSVKVRRGQDLYQKWQIETFNAIISAYEAKLKEYNEKVAAIKAEQTEKEKVNPMFYEQIVNTILRKNCIAYLIKNDNLGQSGLIINRNALPNIRVESENVQLKQYANLVKFMEQAFEWDLMSYNFYPFYWGEKTNWKKMYNSTDIDNPLFRAFLESGMARIMVTVRPGFEEVVNWFMATRQVWNGGQVPTLDDPLFKDLIQELQEPNGVVEETWESRVPTALTILQAGSIGLDVMDALPCSSDCNDNRVTDSEGNTKKAFIRTDVLIGGNSTDVK